jgi:hypothetical protein
MSVAPNAISAVSTARARSELKTASIPSSHLRWPSSLASARPCAESAPPNHPVATSRSLSTVS